VNSDVAPLLSSVSLMLAAFGFFYTTQRDRIDKAIDDKGRPDQPAQRETKRKSVKRARNTAAVLALAALAIWILLLDEIEDRVRAAFHDHLDLDKYSTPDAIFFVAANAWLVVAIYIATRWWQLNKRQRALR
jgi:hypothetical protein